MNYYDFNDYYVNLTKEEREEHENYECEVMENRSRYSMQDALDYDREFVNSLLNKDNLSKVEKHWIAAMHSRTCEEFLESNNTSRSFEAFLEERLGAKAYKQLVGEWLQRKGNEFFQKVGMEEEMKPSAVYFMWNK